MLSIVQSATILTDAQIKALPTTPITLIAAPAAGFRIVPFHFSLRFKVDGGDYTNINATYADIHIETVGGLWVAPAISNDNTLTTPLTMVTDVLQASPANRLVDLIGGFFDPVGTGVSGGVGYLRPFHGGDYTFMDADAIRIAADNNGSGAWTGGHANNTLKVTSYYAIEDLS